MSLCRPKSAPVAGLSIRRATSSDTGKVLVLQRCCWSQVAIQNNSLRIPALHESLDEVGAWIRDWHVLLAEHNGRLIAAARGRARDTDWEVGRLMVAPDFEGKGLGRWLLAQCEQLAPPSCTSYFLFSAPGNARGIEIYTRSGYQEQAPDTTGTGHVEHALFFRKARESSR